MDMAQATSGPKKHSLYEISPLFAGMLIMTASGSVYIVSIYNADLKTILGLTSEQLTSYGTLVSTGTWITLIPVMYLNSYGPKSCSIIGISLVLIGYSCVSAAAYQSIDMSASTLLFLAFLIGFGSAWTQTAAFVTNAVNTLPKNRGTIVGLLQACFALSSGLYLEIYQVFSMSTQFFILFTGLLIFYSVILSYPSNHRIVGENSSTDTVFVLPLAFLVLFTGCVILGSSISGNSGLRVFMVSLFFFLILSVGRVSFQMLFGYGLNAISLSSHFVKDSKDSFELTFFDKYNVNQLLKHIKSNNSPSIQQQSPLLNQTGQNDNEDEEQRGNMTEEDKFDEEKKKVSMTLYEAMRTFEFWILFVIFGLMVGISTTILDNISEIIDAQSSRDSHTQLKGESQQIFSVFNALGRSSFGLLSDYLLVNHAISRYSLLAFSCLIQVIASMLLAYLNMNLFTFTMVLCGLSFGGLSVMINTIALDSFGSNHFGIIIGAINISAIIGTVLLYTVLESELYDHYASNNTCYDNPACFKTTFSVFGGLSLFTLLMSLYMALLGELHKTPSPPQT